MDAFVGTIMPVAFDFAPDGWLLCQGQELQITQYQALFALLGTTYGGDGRSTFKLPDLRGRFIEGANGNCGTIHNSNGKVAISTVNLPAHVHAITNVTSDVNNSVDVPINMPVNPDSTATLTNSPTNNMLATAKVGANPANIYTSTATSTVASLKTFNAKGSIPGNKIVVNSSCSQGGGVASPVPIDVKPNSICINYIICFSGIFPSRS